MFSLYKIDAARLPCADVYDAGKLLVNTKILDAGPVMK